MKYQSTIKYLCLLLLFHQHVIGANIGKEISHQNTTKKEDSLNFRIVEKRDESDAGVSRMTYRVFLDVNRLPSESNILDTALEIWRNGNEGWKEFTIFMYLPEMSTAQTAYAAAEFRQGELKKIRITKWRPGGTK
jgi:hypothetical protein